MGHCMCKAYLTRDVREAGHDNNKTYLDTVNPGKYPGRHEGIFWPTGWPEGPHVGVTWYRATQWILLSIWLPGRYRGRPKGTYRVIRGEHSGSPGECPQVVSPVSSYILCYDGCERCMWKCIVASKSDTYRSSRETSWRWSKASLKGVVQTFMSSTPLRSSQFFP